VQSRGAKFLQVAAAARTELEALAEQANAEELDDLRSATEIASLPIGGGELVRYLALLSFDREEDPHWSKVLWNRVGPFGLDTILEAPLTEDGLEFQRDQLSRGLPKFLWRRLLPLRQLAGESLGEVLRGRLRQSKQQANYSRSTTKGART
jgi:hypothetical protein